MLHPLSPLDGRYASRVEDLSLIFSEFGLMKYRTVVEIEWLFFLSEGGIAPKIGEEDRKALENILENFSESDFGVIKKFEATTNHDVKAVEYFLQEKVSENLWAWIHFACTSEDINNTAYGLMLREGRDFMVDFLESEILLDLKSKSLVWKNTQMLCRTHGQTATPSTMGKEIAVFYMRLEKKVSSLKQAPIQAKINGATGNFAAHSVAFPDQDWISLSEIFVKQKLNLDWTGLTTQIESHDSAVEILQNLSHQASIMIDLCRDVWGYISVGYFGQKTVKGEVGSSTMPHKVNPIDFENGEGNFKLMRGMAQVLIDELPVSRWQRDLTDSTLQRNYGLVFGHFLLALKSLKKGLGKLEIREVKLLEDLEKSPEVLTEAIQTVLRKHGHHDAYEQLKNFSRGAVLDLSQIQKFIEGLAIPQSEKESLKNLKPQDYTGLSPKLVEKFLGS